MSAGYDCICTCRIFWVLAPEREAHSEVRLRPEPRKRRSTRTAFMNRGSAAMAHTELGKSRSCQSGWFAGFVGVAERKESLVARACNHPNCLVLLFWLE